MEAVIGTPGPWFWSEGDMGYPVTELRSGKTGAVVMGVYLSPGGGRVPGGVDAELIALAPLMAEALDSLCDDDGELMPVNRYINRAEDVDRIESVVRKLRAIGESSTVKE